MHPQQLGGSEQSCSRITVLSDLDTRPLMSGRWEGEVGRSISCTQFEALFENAVCP